jgi:8-oxo-dGTP diphosphatase
MDCFICPIVEGEPELLEHGSACWLTMEYLRDVNWLPADLLIVDRIQISR